MEKFQESTSQDVILLLVRACHGALDLLAEGLPLLIGGCGGVVVREEFIVGWVFGGCFHADMSQI